MYPLLDFPFILANATKEAEERLRKKHKELQNLERSLDELESKAISLTNENRNIGDTDIIEKIKQIRDRIKTKKEILEIGLGMKTY